MRKILTKSVVSVWLTILILCVPALPQSKKASTDGDIALELVGQVLNSGTSSLQYGYLTYINGVDNLFAAGAQNETTALFTFYNDTTTVRVINNGPLRVVNRTGTFTIYYDPMPNGDFTRPDSFRDGIPVVTGTLRHQVILNTTDNTFTTTFANTITSVSRVIRDSDSFFLGKAGQKFRLVVFGQSNTAGAGPAQFVIAGYAPGSDLTR